MVADTLLLVVGAGMSGPDDLLDGRQVAGIFRQDRMTDIDVVTIHVRGAVEAAIDHRSVSLISLVPDLISMRRTRSRCSPKHRTLGDDTLAPEDAVVAPPFLAIAP